MPEKHGFPVAEGMAFWWTEGLWAAAADLPSRRVLISDIPEVDLDCWFGPSKPPTVRAVAEHARRIRDADRSHPVILAADGHLMDGGHRIGQALLAGEEYVDAVRFEVTPPPDWVETDPSPDHRRPVTNSPSTRHKLTVESAETPRELLPAQPRASAAGSTVSFCRVDEWVSWRGPTGWGCAGPRPGCRGRRGRPSTAGGA